MEYKGRKYKVLEVLKKSQYPEQDLYVCESEYGYKECFQWYDIQHQFVDAREKIWNWTEEENDFIKEQLAQGKTCYEIASMDYFSSMRSKLSIYGAARRIMLGMKK